jgi:hypothetical protein
VARIPAQVLRTRVQELQRALQREPSPSEGRKHAPKQQKEADQTDRHRHSQWIVLEELNALKEWQALDRAPVARELSRLVSARFDGSSRKSYQHESRGCCYQPDHKEARW